MRTTIAILFFLMTITLASAVIMALRSRRSIGPYVAIVVGSLIPPVLGNLLIIGTQREAVALVGSYIYYLGMDLVMFALVRFTLAYSLLSWENNAMRVLVYGLLCVDAVQLLLNPIFHHAFFLQPLTVEGSVYYGMVPLLGQTFHRIVDYGIFFGVLISFFYKMVTAPRIYMERYGIILLSMIVGGVWETYYIFSRTPIDRSMVGFVVFGLLVFYFALYYRPVRLLNRMLADIASENQDAMFFFDAVGRCIWANRSGIELTGISGEDYEPASNVLRRMFGNLDLSLYQWTLGALTLPGEGDRFYILNKHIVTDSRNRPSGSFLSVRDITEQQLALKREQHNANHDKLTGLYNREHLYECIREMVSENPDTRYMVGFIDIKDFKIVNDIFGHEFGDYALQFIAKRLSAWTPEDGAFGRLGGDTFGVCMPVAEFDAEDLNRRLSALTVKREHVEHPVLIHMGVYEITEPELDLSVMFDRARLALSTIQKDYATHVAYYDDKMREQVLWSQVISSQLHEALRERQICPYLQPIVDQNGKVVGAEALVRWIHPEHGFLPPYKFVPIFEENGMIAEVDRYMWRCACELLASWKGKNDLFLSVNVSPKDFYFMDVAAEIRGVAAEFAIDPSRLRVEITETVMMTDIEKRILILQELQEAGFLVEMDDFGSGYSSLNMLKDMPVGLIKVDMMFLNRSSEDVRGRQILNHVISLTKDLGLLSLTEGVETEEQYHMLTEMGCRLFQGYYFAKPMPVEEFERMAG